MITRIEKERDDLQKYADEISKKISAHYGRPDVFSSPSVILRPRLNDQERRYSAMHHNGAYIVTQEDVVAFADELSDSYEAEKIEAKINLDMVARKLYIGMAMAGTLVHHELERVGRNSNSSRRAKALKEFFGSHDDITEAVRMVFCQDPGFSERSFMVDNLTDERSFVINGLRMSLLFLFRSFNDSQYLGITEEQLQTLGQGHMKRVYSRDGLTLTGVSVVLSQHPTVGDQAAFDAMPSWAIATANPLQDRQVKHLFAQSWQA